MRINSNIINNNKIISIIIIMVAFNKTNHKNIYIYIYIYIYISLINIGALRIKLDRINSVRGTILRIT